jgi:hypothetical protein
VLQPVGHSFVSLLAVRSHLRESLHDQNHKRPETYALQMLQASTLHLL